MSRSISEGERQVMLERAAKIRLHAEVAYIWPDGHTYFAGRRGERRPVEIPDPSPGAKISTDAADVIDFLVREHTWNAQKAMQRTGESPDMPNWLSNMKETLEAQRKERG